MLGSGLLSKFQHTPAASHLVPQPITALASSINSMIDWFQNLPNNIFKMSIDLMSWLYQLCSDLIMKTPLWIFDNDWFSNTTLMFSSISVGIVTTLTVLEGMKCMLSGLKHQKMFKIPTGMDIKEIAKRWFLVAGLTTAVPFLWKTAFKCLNWVSDCLIKMGADNMKGVTMTGHWAALDVVTMIAFDIILIGTIIPVLWQNGRRFFDLIVLGVITPLALTAWIFDDYKHLFNQWWSQVKHLSLVQVYHAVFLLVLGLFIFGTPTPKTFTGLITKILVVIGGFARMVSPPRIIAKHLDNGKGLDEIGNDAKRAYQKNKKNYELSKALIGKPWALVKKLNVGRK